MKKFKILVAITVLATVFVGCPEDADTLTSFLITENITKEVPLAVTANANGECLDYSETATFDIKSNPQINENFSLIQSVKVNSITYEITNFVGDDGVFMSGGLLKVGGTTFDIEEVDLKASDDANTMFVISDANKLAAIANEIKTTGAITVTLETSSGGDCDNDFSYTLKFTANVQVEVQPL